MNKNNSIICAQAIFNNIKNMKKMLPKNLSNKIN